jgi:hypothetical protein
MDAYTVKELKKMIMTYKKSNCPTVSKAKRAELLTMIKDLNISTDGKTDGKKEKTDSCVKCKIKMNLPKVDKIDLKKYENMEEFSKKKKIKTKEKGLDIKVKKGNLIGGNDLFKFIRYNDEFLDNIKILYPTGYNVLKNALEEIRVQNKKDKSFFNIDDYFDKEFENPMFFNKEFFRKLIKREDVDGAKGKLKLLFKGINKKFTNEDIDIPSSRNPIKIDIDYPYKDIYGIMRKPIRYK